MEFDFVIIGAGSAGSVLAGRLSERPQAPSVCLIERGPSHTDDRWSVAMAAGFSYNLNFNNQRDLWLTYRSEPVKQLNGRVIDCPRGTGWGGSSAVNAMEFVRGQPQDFDRWAKDEFCTDIWSFEKCLPYFKRLESYTPGFDPIDSIDPDSEKECANSLQQYRGFDGPIKVASGRLTNRRYSKCPYSPAFIRAGIQAGFTYNPHHNGIVQEGIGWMDANTSEGVKQTSSRCYLLPALSRSNLRVFSQATVSRIILEDKRAVGVEYIDSNGEKHIVRANKEVILCGGTYNSPQILMLSGIGDPDSLRKVGIEPLHELPGVGRNLRDHLLVDLQHATRHPEFSFVPEDWTNDWAKRMIAQWETTKEGWGSSNNSEVCHFFKTNDRQKTANMECVLGPSICDVKADGKLCNIAGISVVFINERPSSSSVGRVGLRSNNPFDDPVIEYNYFSDFEEVREFVDAIHIMRKVLSQPALAEYIGEERLPGPNVQSDGSLEQFIRSTGTSDFHPCGTCRMGDPNAAPTPESARQLVVDAELRVCGLSGLRIVDASVMPSITSGNLNANVMMIAERAADFISAAYYY